MKLSEITLEQCMKPGESSFVMPYDNSDALRSIRNQHDLDQVRRELMGRFGDVEVEVRLDGCWYERVAILDAAWRECHERYVSGKAEWCSENGCD